MTYTSDIENREFFKVGGLVITRHEYNCEYFIGTITSFIVKGEDYGQPPSNWYPYIEIEATFTKQLILGTASYYPYNRTRYKIAEIDIKNSNFGASLNLYKHVIPYTFSSKSLIEEILNMNEITLATERRLATVKKLHLETIEHLIKNCNKIEAVKSEKIPDSK